jgi:hypothetical protein
VNLTGCTASPLLLIRRSPPPIEPYYSSSTEIAKLASSFWGGEMVGAGRFELPTPGPPGRDLLFF